MRKLILLLPLLLGCTYEHKYRVGDKVTIGDFDEPLIVTRLGVDGPQVNLVNKLGQQSQLNENLLKPYVQLPKP